MHALYYLYTIQGFKCGGIINNLLSKPENPTKALVAWILTGQNPFILPPKSKIQRSKHNL
jgi:hypothetical protein